MIIKDENFKETPGLYELIFKTVPLRNEITALNERKFEKIALLTHAHMRNFDPNEQSAGNKGIKFTHKIKSILEKIRTENENKQRTCYKELRTIRGGYGLPNIKMKQENWDDQHESVERLRSLFASKSAGNKNHHNGITSVEEELREAGIIE